MARKGPRRPWAGAAGALALLLQGVPVPALSDAPAAALTDVPVLRIEAGMHTSRIVRADSDAAGRLVITASEDKTARVWDADTGALVQTLRVPIGEGYEGWVYAAALSPDGRTAALGGWMTYGETTDSLFVFDVMSGRMLRRLDGFLNAINDLEYSPDGSFLAVATGTGADSVVLDTATWSTVATLGTNDGSSYNLAWAPDGRLATVSYDGFVRLYDAAFRQTRARRPFALERPFGLAFSPDGRTLAVGFESSARMVLLDGRTLVTLHEADTTDIDPMGDIAKPAWSPDGSRLYAGGSDSFEAEGRWPRYIRVWEDGGRGAYTDLGVSGNTILDLETLADGRLMIAGSQPDIVMLGADLREVWRRDAPSLDYGATDRSHLRLAADGFAVGATPYRRDPLTFDPRQRTLLDQPLEAPAFRDRSGGMAFTDWVDSPAPRLNGRVLDFLDPFEWTRSVSVARDGRFAVVGADWNVYGVNPDGSLRWRIRAPGVAWTVNLSENGLIFVAAYADGTIRWHRAEDGAELLALFIHADGARWIAWTPSGYYDAAPGGEELIGWHVNRGLAAEPVFFPASLFRDRFYRPDVVQAILVTRSEAEAVAAADARRQELSRPIVQPLQSVLPPVLRIESPLRGSEAAGDAVTLDLDVTVSPDAPVTDLRIFINGRPVAAPEPQAEGTRLRLTLDLTGQSEAELWVTVMGGNRHGFGPPADVMLRRPPPDRPGRPLDVKPKLYVLAVGASNYRDPSLALRYAAKDAADFVETTLTQEGGLYRSVEVKLVTDADASYANIREGLFWLEENVTANDTAYIFIAGHGVNDNRGELFFLPHEAEVTNLRRTALAAAEIVRTIEYLPGRVVYFMDTCHSGNLEFTRRAAVPLDLNGHMQDLRAATGAVVFSSATGSQYALESPEWGNGAFTRALREGLAGRADYDRNGAVTVNELNLYVAERVKDLTANRQTPVLRKPPEVADFPLALAQ